MRMKTALSAGVVMFCVACGWVIVDAVRVHQDGLRGQVLPLAATTQNNSFDAPETGANEGQSEVERGSIDSQSIVNRGSIEGQSRVENGVKFPILNAHNNPAKTVRLGAIYEDLRRTDDPNKYKFLIKLTTKGAAVESVVLTEFEARHIKESQSEVLSADPSGGKAIQPLVLLSPLTDGRTVYTLANASLRVAPVEADAFGTKSFPLDKLNWKLVETNNEDMAQFEAVLFEEGQNTAAGEGTLKLIKTYRIEPGSYEMMTEMRAENLSGQPLKVQMEIQGPTGIAIEDVRQDARKVVAAHKNTEVTTRLLPFAEIQTIEREKVQPSQGIWASIRKLFGKDEPAEVKLQLDPDKPSPFIWAAITNKYFAAITRPVTDTPGQSVIEFGSARYYGSLQSKAQMKESAGAVSYVLDTGAQEPLTLSAAGTEGAVQQFTIGTYLGPKDKDIFEHNPVYKSLGYFQTIDFRSCCCPASMIAPLAFGIIWLMKSMYTLMGPWGNYGVVIMVLVFIVRLILHPVTKKSQVSMMKMQKLGPRMQEIQKKYANNKAEMNKQVMQLYKEGGATPVMGMLPMFLQMPIWIALWTAVYTSIDLRGAGFLPFWITDLSAPDHLFRIPFAAALQQIPLLGAIVPEYFNLLPILMGVVMYLQQKLMPMSQAAATNPQVAQQQKMMMIMMPLLFPIMLYNGPSGVNLYIMSSIGAGVIEQKVIRKHIAERQEEEEKGKVPTTAKLGGKLKKKKPKPFFKMK